MKLSKDEKTQPHTYTVQIMDRNRQNKINGALPFLTRLYAGN